MGETLSSGTGATGAAVAYVLAAEPVARAVRRALRRASSWCSTAASSRSRSAEDLHVHLTGWARPVFEGRLSEEFVKELQDIG